MQAVIKLDLQVRRKVFVIHVGIPRYNVDLVGYKGVSVRKVSFSFAQV